MPDSPSQPVPNASSTPREAAPERSEERWIDRLRLRLGLKPQASIRENLAEVLDDNAPASTGFTPEERAMLKNILQFKESRVFDIAVPRADIVAVQKDVALADVMQTFEDAGHTRLVVYDDTLDDPVGMVHIKDLVAHLFTDAKKAARAARRKTKTKAKDDPTVDLGTVDLSVTLAASKLIRPILFVPPSMPAVDLLARMQATRIQLALVVDEYGGTDGLVALKDVVERIVGEIDDEHEEDNGRAVIPTPEGAFVADGRAAIEDVREALGAEFDPGEEVSSEVDTLGGYLAVLAGHVPVRGELVPGPGPFEFEVLDADPRRVKRVKITRGKTAPKPPRAPRRREDVSEPAPEQAVVAPPLPAPAPPPATVAPAEPPGKPS